MAEPQYSAAADDPVDSSRPIRGASNASADGVEGEVAQARREFVSMMAHELGTPLATVKLQLESTLRRLEREAERQPNVPAWIAPRLQAAERQVARLDRLLATLLESMRSQGDALRLQRESVDMADVIREVVQRLNDELVWARSSCSVCVTGPIVGVWDRQRLDQIVTNLLSNAMKYGGGSPIEVGARVFEGAAELWVADRGPGIAECDQRRIFDAFERANAREATAGFGLGLWIVQRIVQGHGGTIGVQSTPGEGARFNVTLPLEPPGR